MRLLFIFLTVVAIQPACGDDRPGVDSLESAFTVVFGTQVMYDYVRGECARWFPDLKQSIDRHFFLWEDRSKEEISASQRLGEARESEQLNAITAIFLSKTRKRMAVVERESEESRFTYCLETATFASSEEGSIAAHSPNASRLLLDYLAENPLSVRKYRYREHTIGCIKQGLNMGSDFDELSDTCSCVTTTLLGSMTDAELDEFFSVASEQGQSTLLELPQVVKVMSQVRLCYSIPGAYSVNGADGRLHEPLPEKNLAN